MGQLTIKQRLLDALKSVGPMTSPELAEETGLDIVTIRSRICELRREKRLRIASWRRTEEGGRLYPRAVWTTAPGIDAVRPPPQSGTESSRRYRNRKKVVVNSVFALAIKPKHRKVPSLLKKAA